jgi:small subunit ribosomal protein S17
MVDQVAATQGETPRQVTSVNRKSRVGTVVSDHNDKTIVVSIQRTSRHRLYRKVIRRSKRYHVHDEANEATVGDLVRIEECRPYSRLKRWRLVEILTEREVAEVAPESLDEELVDEVQRSAARAAAEAEDVAEAEDSTAASAAEAPAAEEVPEPAAVEDPEPVAQPDPQRTEPDPGAESPDEVMAQVGGPNAEPVAEPAAEGDEDAEKAP